jgi:hypothetical protein
MSQIGCCLIIIVRTFVGEVGKNTSDSTFHPFQINPEKPDVPLNKNDAFQKVQKRRVQEKR